MAKDPDYNSKLKNFADRVKSEPAHIAVQKITPLHDIDSVRSEQQLNVWIPKELMKRLKLKGAEVEMSLKEMVIEALSKYV